MYDFLSFIDSPDIREYNRDTDFSPAEWAVLVPKSFGRTVKEKIEALQYLADNYTAAEFEQEHSMQEDHWQYFSSYEKAWGYLLQAKQEYLEDEKLKNVKTYAWIKRIKLDRIERSDGESYLFDHEMCMVEVGIDGEKFFAGKKEIALVYDYLAYVPLPFEMGDIVRVDFPHMAVHYGVFSCEWEKPEITQRIRMWVSLDI